MAELIWDGKYDEHGNKRAPVRIELPFQTVETVNESVQERQRTLELSSSGHDPEWRNRLIWGDKKYVLPSLLPEFAGKVDLIYIDPPFNTSQNFSYTVELPAIRSKDPAEIEFRKEPSVLERKAYRDTWGVSAGDRQRGVSTIDRYARWLYETAFFFKELIGDSGSIYVHLDTHVGHYAKTVLDEALTPDFFRSEIVWKRTTSHSDSTAFGSVHDTILFYAALGAKRNEVLQQYDPEYIENYYRYKEPSGRRFMSADLSGDGPGPARTFGKKGTIKPPAGRHWMFDQDGIDKALAGDRIFWTRNDVPRFKKYLDESPGMPAADLWADVQAVRSWHKEEDTGYDTQKPEALLDRIIKASSNERDLVLDCFCGSGTTAAVAEKQVAEFAGSPSKLSSRAEPREPMPADTRRQRGKEFSAAASVRGVRGEDSLHRRSGRQAKTGSPSASSGQAFDSESRFASESASSAQDDRVLEEQRRREAAYRKFILELYHATPVSGHAWLHGVKAGRMVHVGAVDAPVTRADVNAIAAEVWKASGKGPNSPQKPAVDVLGWEFALEINETAKEIAAQARVDAAFKKIPREVLEKKAVEQGDVHFFELGALKVDSKIKKRDLTLTLSDFVIPLDDVPAEVRSAIKHWSQMVDYWAVDWDFKDDTFHNQWQSYRTRKNPKLELSVKHEYVDSGKHTVVVKVIDILGNDTTKTLMVEIG